MIVAATYTRSLDLALQLVCSSGREKRCFHPFDTCTVDECDGLRHRTTTRTALYRASRGKNELERIYRFEQLSWSSVNERNTRVYGVCTLVISDVARARTVFVGFCWFMSVIVSGD